MRSPYDIYESIYGYDPDKPNDVIYSIWYGRHKQEYLQEHPEARKNMIDGNMFADELERFFVWLDEKYQDGSIV